MIWRPLVDTFVTVQGNLVADPTARTVSGGTTVVNFRVASSGRRFDRAAQTFRDTDPLFINVSCWRQLATHVLSSLRKGDSVLVHGRLTYRTFDDRAGVHRGVHDIDAMAVGPDLTRCPVLLRRTPRPEVLEPVPPARPEPEPEVEQAEPVVA
jgi:single-strand DNA-binding protein